MKQFPWYEDEFLKSFFYELNIYCEESYKCLITYYTSSNFDHFIGHRYTPVFIMLTKSVFQHVHSFLYFIQDRAMIFPAFNGLRSAIEGIRLIRALQFDSDFRDEYMYNKNTSFDTVPDYTFMQQRVNKVLDKLEKELRDEDMIPASIILSNHELTKGSAVSRLHSELSKWSHMLNSNLIGIITPKEKIYLGLNNELENEPGVSEFIRKYLEGLYISISKFDGIHSSSKELYESQKRMSELYSKFIDIYYT